MGYIPVWGGTVSGPRTTTLNGALGDNVYGTGGSGTSITLASVVGFPTTGTNYIQVGTEEISYTGVSGSDLTGINKSVRGTTRAAHSDGATVTNTSDYLHGTKQLQQRIKLLNLVYGPWTI